MTPLAQSLAASPELFPGALNHKTEAVTLWRLSRGDYEDSAFLDGRIAAGKVARQVPFVELAQAVGETGLPESCHFIFHLGHAGSTLLSRLLGKHLALFSVREPEILRTLTVSPPHLRERFLSTCLRLWSRTFEPRARAIIKTTSFVSEIASDLLSRAHKPRAVALGVPPETYLATIFGGANAPAEARALAPFRIARLKRRLAVDWRLEVLAEGEIIALGWLCEALCLTEAATAAKGRVLILNFERLLCDVSQNLRPAFAHFDVRPTESEIAEVLAGPQMRTYSKAPEYQYDAETRRAVLAEGRAQHASEIRRGLLWLERAAAEHSQIARALTLFD